MDKKLIFLICLVRSGRMERYNINGDRMCSSTDCRRHTKLVWVDDMPWCRYHAMDITTRQQCVEKLFSQKKTGLPTCNAIGCDAVDTVRCFGGRFCARHQSLMINIRSKVDHSGSTVELEGRLEEIELRKFPSAGHIEYAHFLQSC